MSADPLRVMLDKNVADVLLEDEILRNGLRDLLDHAAAEIYITHNVVDEVLETVVADDRDRANRLIQALFHIGARTLRTSGGVWGKSRWDLAIYRDDDRVSQFTEGNAAHLEDALIAGTAEANDLVLVTQEKRIGRAARHVPDLPVISVDELRKRVNARLIAEGRLDAGQLPLIEKIQSGEVEETSVSRTNAT